LTDAPKSWFVYLIECRDGSLYTGITTDVAARYAAHAAGKGARYTRSHPPSRLLVSEAHPDRSAAAKAEYRIKQLTPAEKRAYAVRLKKPD
jgi:putative endonuclease